MPEYFPRHVDDVRSAARTLIRLLHNQNVPHIVNAIIDCGEYWPRYERSNDRHSHVEDAQYRQRGRGRPYLVAALVAPDEANSAAARYALRKIRFTVRGRDQGWHTSHGTPDGKSWTWWSAVSSPSSDSSSAITHDEATRIHAAGDPTSPERVDPPPGPDYQTQVRTTGRASQGRVAVVNGHRRHESHGLKLVDTERAHAAGDVSGLAPEDWLRGPELARNELDCETAVEYVAEASVFDEGGLGDWVRTLDLDRVVGVSPMALYPGWKCVTEYARIEVYLAAFVV